MHDAWRRSHSHVRVLCTWKLTSLLKIKSGRARRAAKADLLKSIGWQREILSDRVHDAENHACIRPAVTAAPFTSVWPRGLSRVTHGVGPESFPWPPPVQAAGAPSKHPDLRTVSKQLSHDGLSYEPGGASDGHNFLFPSAFGAHDDQPDRTRGSARNSACGRKPPGDVLAGCEAGSSRRGEGDRAGGHVCWDDSLGWCVQSEADLGDLRGAGVLDGLVSRVLSWHSQLPRPVFVLVPLSRARPGREF